MEGEKPPIAGLTSFSSNQQAAPVPWNGMKWMPWPFKEAQGIYLLWEEICWITIKCRDNFGSQLTALPQRPLEPTCPWYLFFLRQASHLLEITFLVILSQHICPRSLKKWHWQWHAPTPGMIKIRDMENCHSVPINFIGKQKSKCVSDFFH